ncbi:endonuclease domain-containing protein [Geodermatophilus nigrescens]|uniref:Recombination endonuclease VII n=1 Tax=Geodermatophilus nigrescens TaxID=1070870 RepID=A0A1M5HYA0_9ACTN|nr:endonuclease domain-containing protein [Geodermatophilus nigrescens]SHG20849.1 Recombination endonuclease VII [Geodermatophilus nigrescens]
MDKRCPSCGEHKPAAQFGRNRSLSDGLSFYCLSCNRERNNRWYRESRRRQGKEVRDLSWVPEGSRWCPVCRQAVAHEDYVRSSRTASGFGSRCKSCHNATNKAAYRQRQYGMSDAEVHDLRVAQANCCAICSEADPRHLDHDHRTGVVRGWLCQRCNHGLGLFRDHPTVLRDAARYVERHREGPAPDPGPREGTPRRHRRSPPPTAPAVRRRSAGCPVHERREIVRARAAALFGWSGAPGR